jgi:hypothetical protein
MISDAYVKVTCDRCKDCEYELRCLAITRQAYDLRRLADALRPVGWRREHGKDICPNCVEDEAVREGGGGR